jgi:hypothetical protein
LFLHQTRIIRHKKVPFATGFFAPADTQNNRKKRAFSQCLSASFHPKNTISWGGVFRLVKPIVEISFTEKMIFGTAHWPAMSLNFTPQIMTLARRRGPGWRAASPSSSATL